VESQSDDQGRHWESATKVRQSWPLVLETDLIPEPSAIRILMRSSTQRFSKRITDGPHTTRTETNIERITLLHSAGMPLLNEGSPERIGSWVIVELERGSTEPGKQEGSSSTLIIMESWEGTRPLQTSPDGTQTVAPFQIPDSLRETSAQITCRITTYGFPAPLKRVYLKRVSVGPYVEGWLSLIP
jgi:hypothetical protein